MNADLPQLRVLRYAPLPTMRWLFSIHSSFFPLDFPPSFTPLRLGTLTLLLSAHFSRRYRSVFRVYLSSSSPSPPYFFFLFLPLSPLSKIRDTIHSPRRDALLSSYFRSSFLPLDLRGLGENEKRNPISTER